jgi:hypothetical protein
MLGMLSALNDIQCSILSSLGIDDKVSNEQSGKLFKLIEKLYRRYGKMAIPMIDGARWKATDDEVQQAVNSLSPGDRCMYGCQDSEEPSKRCQCYTIDNEYGIGSYCSGCFQALLLFEFLSSMKPFAEDAWIQNDRLRNFPRMCVFDASHNRAASDLIIKINAALARVDPKNVDKVVTATIDAVAAVDVEFSFGAPCAYGCDDQYTATQEGVPMCSACHAAAVMLHTINKAAP